MMKIINVISFIMAFAVWAMVFAAIVPEVSPSGTIGGETILITFIGVAAFGGIRYLLATLFNDFLEIINNDN